MTIRRTHRLLWVVPLIACSPHALFAKETASRFAGTLFYSRLTQGTWQVWQRDLATDERAQRTFSPGDKRYPSWAGNGRIAFCTANQDCYALRDGRAAPDPLLERLWPVKDVVWSPDGARVAFARFRTDLADNANVWVAFADGSDQRMLTHEPGIQYNPSWSPDGTQLVYTGGQGYGTYELYVINADGTNQRRLTHNTHHEFLPAWSPDGARIAFASDASGDYEIWVMRADGSDAKPLTRSPGLDTRPAWSPDGSRIAFVTNRTGTLEIWVMNPDGSDQRPLERAEGGVCDPAWR